MRMDESDGSKFQFLNQNFQLDKPRTGHGLFFKQIPSLLWDSKRIRIWTLESDTLQSLQRSNQEAVSCKFFVMENLRGLKEKLEAFFSDW